MVLTIKTDVHRYVTSKVDIRKRPDSEEERSRWCDEIYASRYQIGLICEVSTVKSGVSWTKGAEGILWTKNKNENVITCKGTQFKVKKVTLDLHTKIIDPDLVLQAVIETIASMPQRKIGRVMLIPGYGNHSSSAKAGIQSCTVATLLMISNIKIERLEGKYLISKT